MKLYAKIRPHYFDQIKAGKKHIDFRQFESITFYNTETGEEIECEVEGLFLMGDKRDLKLQYPDVKWHPLKQIYGIVLGKIL